MDKHFSDIIDTFKRLNEAANPRQQAAIAINMKKKHQKPKNEDFGPAATAAIQQGKSPTEVSFAALNDKNLGYGPKNEGSMEQAEHHPRGAKFGGYWKGTQKSPPRPGQGIGGACESIENEIAHEWYSYLQEYGMTTGGTTLGGGTSPSSTSSSSNPVDQAKMAKELSDIGKGVNKAKSAGVLPSNASTTQSSQAIAAGVSDIAKANPQQKKEMTQAAQGFNDFVKAASTSTQGQSALNTVLNQMKKVKMSPGT
jgi:hypothetical protein